MPPTCLVAEARRGRERSLQSAGVAAERITAVGKG